MAWELAGKSQVWPTNLQISMRLVERLATWANLVAFSHSIFALPFALIMVVLVSDAYPVSLIQLVLLVLCVVAARTAAMAFNRYVDAEIDARNPRTHAREIPAGVVSRREGLGLVVVSSMLFIGGSAALGSHCLILAPLVVLFLLGYSLVKRFSSLCHLVLGIALSLAPGGVWYALTAEWSWKPVPLMIGVSLWVTGFDVLYSSQDADFDKREGLFSLPSRLGIKAALSVSALLHLGTLGALVANGFVFSVGYGYWCGIVVFAALLFSQHYAVTTRGLGCIDRVFFTRNGAASVLLLVFVVVDKLL